MKTLCVFYLATFLNILSTSYALDEKCTTTADCTLKEKTVCIDNTCQCNPLSNYSNTETKCLSYATKYDTLCYEDWQCQDFLGDNSQCLNNACLCKDGSRWYRGRCQEYAKKGEACDSSVLCLDVSNPLALTCSNNICQCSEGYYDRGEDCRVKSAAGGECAISSDCLPSKDMFGNWETSHCELGKCVKDNLHENSPLKEFNNTFNYSKPKSVLQKLWDKNKAAGTTTTESGDTKCPNGVLSDLTEQECSECPNTIYFRNVTCICEPGFFLSDGDHNQCIAELGVEDPYTQYTTDKECPIKPGKAVNGTCYCKDYWFQSSTNTECKKTTLEYTRNCLDNDWCKAMGPYAYCDTDTEKCQCSSLAVLNETSFYCELLSGVNVSSICLDSSECPLYETCANEGCGCDDGFYRVNESSLCLPEIGSTCEVRDCSHIDYAECSNESICQCESEEFVTNGTMCVLTVDDLYDQCLIEQQCKNIPNSDCLLVSTSDNVTSECVCSQEYLDVNGTCYESKQPGSQCSTKFNCTIILGDTFECRNNLCQCAIGQELSSDKICVSSSASQRFSHSVLPGFISVLSVILLFKFW